MADVELVIKIPEETVNKIKDNAMFAAATNEILFDVTSAIVNSTPLPSGHGGLIDVDNLIKRAKQYIDNPNKYISQRNKDFIYILEREEVIIPADKEE